MAWGKYAFALCNFWSWIRGYSLLRGQQTHYFTLGVGWESSVSQENQDLALVTRSAQPAHFCVAVDVTVALACSSSALTWRSLQSPAGLEAEDAEVSLKSIYHTISRLADLSCNSESETLKKDNDSTMGTVLPPYSSFTCRNPRHITSYSLVPRTHHLWDWPSAW